jgi:hypothetical protein
MPASACLVSFFRDESENLEKMLRSIEGLYSHYCIGIDNATTDDTEAILRDWFKGREHLGVMTHFDWPEGGFAAARNMHLDLALKHYPEDLYCLSVDGDDVLDPRARPIVQAILRDAPTQYGAIHSVVYLDEDIWGCPFIFYPRPILLLNRPDVRYIGAAHNVIQVPEEEQLLVESLIVHHKQAPLKRKMREQQRMENNIPALERQAAEHPEDARALFYSGNTRLDAGDPAAAEADYLAYLAIAKWPNERYQARLHLAAIRFTAGDVSGAAQHIWAALQEPDQFARAEAYMHLSDCALAEGRVLEAIHWLSIAGEMPPPVSSMFLNGAIYTYLPHWRLALLYDKLGAYDRALRHAQRAYAWRPAPEFGAAVEALELTLKEHVASQQDGAEGHLSPPHALMDGLSMSTQVLPLPEAELERMINEIPRWTPEGADRCVPSLL